MCVCFENDVYFFVFFKCINYNNDDDYNDDDNDDDKDNDNKLFLN